MKRTIRGFGRRGLSLLLALSMMLVLVPFSAFAADTYSITVDPSTATVEAGSTVTLTAKVTKNGTEITDLASESLQLWWWTDTWATGHTSGNNDATYSTTGGDGTSLTTNVYVPSVGTYYVAAELSGYSTVYATITVTEATEANTYAVSVTSSATTVSAGSTVTLDATVTQNGETITDLEAAGLSMTTWLDYYEDNGHGDGNSDATIASPNALSTTVTLPTEGTYYLVTDVYNSSWATLASYTTTITVTEASVGYVVTVTPSTTDVKPGDTVTLTISVTNNGEAVTELPEGTSLTTWLDYYEANGHTDGNSDATIASPNALSTTVTLPTEGTYYLVTELYDVNNSYAVLASATTTFTVAAASTEMTAITLENGDFETGDSTNWTLVGFNQITKSGTTNTSYLLNLWLSDTEDTAGSAAYKVNLTAGTYQFGFDLSGSMGDCLSYSVTAGSTTLATGSETYSPGWDTWTTYTTDKFTLTEDTAVTFTLSGTVPLGYWGYLDNLTLKGTGSIAQEEDTSVQADIDVKKVSGLSEDFIMGMDISSVISEFKSGVTYKDFEGNTIDNVTDFCKFLAECGVTHVRVRVWNDPYDANGNGYGGGNNDIDTAVEIAKGCAAAGLKMLVDFHCSDFWTDPSKQMVPKAWTGFTVDQKADALKTFLTNSLTAIKATGVTIAMVQVGNETTGGFIGETSTANMCTLFSAGSAAIRAFDPSIKVVIHVTNPEKSTMTTWAKNLSDNSVDYDILATSYYPSWHGTFANLKSQLQTVKDTYGKDVMVAETSYAFTLDDTDGHENTIREGNNDTMMCETQYNFTPQGQANYLRDLIAAVNEAGGLGVFYWESAWITVGDTTGLTGDDYTAQVNSNKATWEEFGSGWASSYSAEYDPTDAGKWYGGSAVDNQAMFYADGSPVASINVWKLVKTGAYTNNVTVEAIPGCKETIEADGTYTLPETVTVSYNKGDKDESVSWNEADKAAIDINTVGTYVVHGTVTLDPHFGGETTYAGSDTASVTYTLTVKYPNLIDANAASFEISDSSDFTISANSGITLPSTDDPKEGSKSLHWFLEAAGTATVTYNGAKSAGITLEPGTYIFECAAQGYAKDTVTLSVLNHDTTTAIATGEATALTGWAVWATPTVGFTLTETTTVDLQMTIGIQAGGWGTIDCMYLHVAPENYYSDIFTYRTGETYSAPTKTGYAFAGWYADADFTTPISSDTTSGDAYAKFVDEKVLSVKWQILAGTNAQSENTDLRLITTVDSLDYQNVGFQIIFNDKPLGSGEYTTRTVYSTIAGWVAGTSQEYAPTVFSSASYRFMTFRINNIPSTYFGTEWQVTPFWTTLDGTKVTGVTNTFKISDDQDFNSAG